MSTPETDSLLRKCHNSYGDERAELIQFCRKMERERDQARDRQWADGIHSCHNECARPMCVLRRERDEATERLNYAEILLSDLASDYWRSILNEQDPSGEGIMGERVAQYQAQLPTTKP